MTSDVHAEPWFDTQHRRNNLARNRAEDLIQLKPIATATAQYTAWSHYDKPGPACPACPHRRDDHDGMGCMALDYQCSCRVSIVSLTPLPRWEVAR